MNLGTIGSDKHEHMCEKYEYMVRKIRVHVHVQITNPLVNVQVQMDKKRVVFFKIVCQSISQCSSSHVQTTNPLVND